MTWFGNTKDRPSKADLLKAVDQHFGGCGCEANSHTITESVTINGYVYDYTITRVVRPQQRRS